MRIFGHPLHPALVHFPIALWSLASVSDGLFVLGFDKALPYAWTCLAAGSVLALPAMAAGFLDLASLAEPAVKIGTQHMMLMSGAWGLYLAALLTRSDGLTPVPEPGWLSYLLSAGGFLLMIAGGWRGGELVYRFGAGGARSAPPG